jgi:hypothetical protein
VRFEQTARFEADLRRLSSSEFRLFRQLVQEKFAPACERRRQNPSARWPAILRVKSVQGRPGVWEMTWSFSGPDGRATFEWLTIDGESRIRWRRVGGHDIFRAP